MTAASLARHDMRAQVGVLAILAACTCVAGGTLMTKHLLDDVPALPLVFLQLAASCIGVWTAAATTRRLPTLREAPRLARPGVLQPGLAYLLAFTGLHMVPVSVEGLLLALETAFVVVLAWPLLGERPSRATIFATALGTAGVVLIAGDAPVGTAPVIGIVLVLGGVVAASLDTIVSRRLAIDAHPLTMTAASHSAGLLLIGLSFPLWPAGSFGFDPVLILEVAASGMLIHGIATVLFNFGLGRVAAGQAATLFPAISVLTTAGGVVWFGDRLSVWQTGGGAMVLVAALVVARSPGPIPLMKIT